MGGIRPSSLEVSNDKLGGEHEGQIDAEEDPAPERPCVGRPTGGGGGLQRAGVWIRPTRQQLDQAGGRGARVQLLHKRVWQKAE
jgi:hypothetical protein